MPQPARLPPTSPTKDVGDFLFLRGAISRWLWRIYTQRLTPGGRWFALASLVFFAYGGVSLQLQGYVLAGYVLALWMVAAGAMLIYRPRVRLQAALTSRVCAGETITAVVQIEQRGLLRGADLFLLPHRLPADIDSVPADGAPVVDLPRGRSAQVRVGLLCRRRGAYTLRGFRVETGFPFNILRARLTFPEERRLLVYPKFTPLPRLDLPTGRRYQPGGVAMISQLGESFEYLGNREYREGDNPRDIDWRATARATKPIVREWVEEYMFRAAVILDTHIPARLGRKAAILRRDDFERAVSVAAAVSDHMARQDYLVDLFSAGPNLYHLTAGRSLAYLDQILDILACVEENPAEPFDTIEPQLSELLERLSTVICVFLQWNAARRDFALRLQSHGAAVKIIIVREGRCELDPALDRGLLGEIPVISREQYDAGVSQL